MPARDAIEAARGKIERFRATASLPRDEALGLLDDAFAELGNAAAQASLLRNVHPSAEVRDAAEQDEQELDAFQTGLSLDRGLYEALARVDLTGADAVTHWMVEKSLRDFRRAGVDRDEATRARVRELRDELVRIGQEFGRNVRDDVKSLRVDPAELAGLPADWLRARPPGEDGKIAVTTDPTDYVPVVTWAESAGLRERLWRLQRQRAHPANLEVLSRMLSRRAELARLLGHPTWAAYATEDKMIGGEAQAAAFVERISAAAGPRMERDHADLLARKRLDLPGAGAVDPWDSTFYAERIKAERFGADARAARPYLEYGAVRDGILDLTATLFGISYRRVEAPDAWHPEVEVFDVLEGDRPLGRIWLDMHPREGKYKHFAQFTRVNGQAGRRLPEGVLVCNFPRPGEAPALLDLSEVRTLLHEFGHLLHHVLGGHTRWSAHSGVATEWDFVEAPSQLLEEWVRDPEVLRRFARHVETGEPIPADLVRRLDASEEFGKGLTVRQQMFYAAVSLELHRRDPEGLDTTALVAGLMERYTPFRHVPGTFFHASFGHLDGYSALYYTYMWSLVIAKDLFSAFQAKGILSPEPARRYRRAVLEPGGSKPARELVRDFLGRDSDFAPFERWLSSDPA
ncbi:MAG: M3 family metallopeptidase [Deltaproteobacteria bacterium]